MSDPAAQRAQPPADFSVTAQRLARQALGSPAARSVAWVLVVIVAALATAPQSDVGGLARLLLVLTLGSIFLIWVHEGGHLIAGSLVGVEFTALIVGPLYLYLDGERTHTEFHDESLFSGAVIGFPTKTDRVADRCLVTLAGGPAANLIVALVLVFPLASSGLSPALRLSIQGLCILSFAMMAVNLLPVRFGHRRSDGVRIAELLGGGPRATRAAAQQTLASLARAGFRPRDWDEGLIDQLIAPHDGTPEEAFACNLACYWAHDRGDNDLAAAFLERYMALYDCLPPALRPAVWADAAFFLGLWKQPRAARRALDEARSELTTAPPLPSAHLRHTLALDLLRAEAAVLHAEGDSATAHDRCLVWLREIVTVPTVAPGLRRATTAWVEALRDAACPEEESLPLAG